jgi:hypothetical protein
MRSKSEGDLLICKALLHLYWEWKPLSKSCVFCIMWPWWNVHKLYHSSFSMGNGNFRAELCNKETHVKQRMECGISLMLCWINQVLTNHPHAMQRDSSQAWSFMPEAQCKYERPHMGLTEIDGTRESSVSLNEHRQMAHSIDTQMTDSDAGWCQSTKHWVVSFQHILNNVFWVTKQ